MRNQLNILVEEKIAQKIFIIRGKKIMLDHDLAELYGVKTHRLNEQIKRNIKRFPEDFMFQITDQEKAEVIANCDNLKKLKFSPSILLNKALLCFPASSIATRLLRSTFIRLR